MLQLDYILGLEAFGALRDAEFDLIPFVQGLEAGSLDGRVMNEDVIAGFAADESIAFFVVEPLYCTLFCHSSFSVIDAVPAWQECFGSPIFCYWRWFGGSTRKTPIPFKSLRLALVTRGKHLIEQMALYYTCELRSR